jgi:predicted RecA/RadA family phage recombinase
MPRRRSPLLTLEAGADFECLTAGVVELPASAQAFAFGAKVYWNIANKTGCAAG